MSTDIAAVVVEALSGSTGDLDVSSVAVETLSGSTGVFDVSSVAVEALSGDLINFFGIASVGVEVLASEPPDDPVDPVDPVDPGEPGVVLFPPEPMLGPAPSYDMLFPPEAE